MVRVVAPGVPSAAVTPTPTATSASVTMFPPGAPGMITTMSWPEALTAKTRSVGVAPVVSRPRMIRPAHCAAATVAPLLESGEPLILVRDRAPDVVARVEERRELPADEAAGDGVGRADGRHADLPGDRRPAHDVNRFPENVAAPREPLGSGERVVG